MTNTSFLDKIKNSYKEIPRENNGFIDKIKNSYEEIPRENNGMKKNSEKEVNLAEVKKETKNDDFECNNYCYQILQRILEGVDFGISQNPIDIGIELGYSEFEMQETFIIAFKLLNGTIPNTENWDLSKLRQLIRKLETCPQKERVYSKEEQAIGELKRLLMVVERNIISGLSENEKKQIQNEIEKWKDSIEFLRQTIKA